MNANELADALQETEPYYSTDYKLFDNAAAMLRQQQEQINNLEQWQKRQLDVIEAQQAEIEALKAQIAELTEQNDAYYEESGKTYD